MSTIYTLSYCMFGNDSPVISGTYTTLIDAQTAMSTMLTDAQTAGGIEFPSDTFDIVTDSGGYFGYVRKNDIISISVSLGVTDYPENPLTNSIQSIYRKFQIQEISFS